MCDRDSFSAWIVIRFHQVQRLEMDAMLMDGIARGNKRYVVASSCRSFTKDIPFVKDSDHGH